MTPFYFFPDEMLKHAEYSDRAPSDFVVGGFVGPGRRFETRADARDWVRARYGNRVKRALPNCVGRWGYLVRGEKQ